MLKQSSLKYAGAIVGTVFIAVLGTVLPGVSAPLDKGEAAYAAQALRLRGGYDGQCVAGGLCAISHQQTGAKISGPPDQPILLGEGRPGGPALSLPGDPTGPATNVDWSLSLRGAYEHDGSGDHFEALVNPSVDIVHLSNSAEYVLGADAELVASGNGNYRLSQGVLSFGSTHNLSQVTLLTLSAALSAEQASANDPNLATGVTQAPVIINANAGIGVERRLGRTRVVLRGRVEREIFGGSFLANGTWQNNDERNNIGLEGGMRVSHQLTGVLEGFVDGSVQREIHDLPSSGLGVTQDNTTYAIRGGLSGTWGERFIAEASVGYAIRHFDSATLGDVPVVLADFTMTYRPTNTLELRAAIATGISAPDPAAISSTRIDYDASVDITYRVNQRLSLRSSVAGNWARFANSAAIRRGYSVGFGGDYNLTPHTDLIADYTYGVSENTPGAMQVSHRITAGVTYSR